MASRSTILLLAVFALTGLLPLRGQAQDEGFSLEEVEKAPTPVYTSEIEVGIGKSSEDSFKFGEYTGLEDDNPYFIGNILARKRSAYDGDDTTYWEIIGNDLGLDSRSIEASYGQQGLFNLTVEYDQLPHFRLDDARTPFNGAGSADQTLPAGWVGATSTAGMTLLNPSLHNIEVETDRERLGGSFKWLFTDNWLVSGGYRHENKDGTETIGAIFGNSGGNPRSSILAYPVDYDTDEFDIAVAYTGEQYQYSLSYHLSLFDNNESQLVWDNPFNFTNTATSIWSPGTRFSDGARGALALAPDNEAHLFTFAGGYNLNDNTRMTANISYGWMTQDDAFMPYTTITALAPVPLPRTSLDGEIDTLHANFNVSTGIGKLNLFGRYTYDDRDNDTPVDLYLRVPGDSLVQAAPLSDNARLNRPYSLTGHKLELDADYRVTLMTKLSAGYEFESKDRDLSEADTDEHTFKVKLSTSPFNIASGWVQYSHAIRDNSDYISNQPFLDGHNPAFIATEAPDDRFENDPLLRKPYMADRRRSQLTATANFYPTEVATVTATGAYAKDDYNDTEVGLQESKSRSFTVDLGYAPMENLNTYIFGTHEHYDNNQRGYSRRGGTFPPGAARNPGDFWTIETEDSINTLGAGVDWAIVKDKFNLKADYSYSHARTKIVPNSVNQAFLPLDDVTTWISSFNLTGEYKFKENMGFRLKYWYERFSTRDFALDRVLPNTLANVILLGNTSPEYDQHVFGITYFYNY